ncbi:MAG: hypothetical protein IMF08_18630 [Proteobacteria bacterium]|nr:hypothetical protein [Pseudomonadota bacterium]
MSVSRSNMATAAALHDNLGSVEPMPRRSDRKVPEKPTMEMLAAGSIAGGVSVEAAWNIYQAMLKAAS